MNNLEKHFVNYQQAMYLKSIGFDEPCFGRYQIGGDFVLSHTERYVISNGTDRTKYFILRPLKSQVFEWFREKHGLFSEIQPYLIIGTQWRYTITNRNNSSGLPHKEQFKTYEEAESACIDKLIELCHDK